MNVITGFSIILMAHFSTSAFGLGTSSGGGGVGVRCHLSNGAQTLETLDVHEAKLNGLLFAINPQSESEAVDLASAVMANHYLSGPFKHVSEYQDFLKERFFERMFRWQSVEESAGNWIQLLEVSNLPLSNDYGNYKIAAGCALEQIAFFNDERSVLEIDRNLFDQLDYLNRSVLFAHEMMYFVDRNYPSLHDDFDPTTPRTSEVSRAFVGKLFSSTPPLTKRRNAEVTPYFICGNDLSEFDRMTEFRIYQNANGTFSILTGDMNGFHSPFRMSETVGFNPADLLKFNSELNYHGALEVSDFKSADAFSFEIRKDAYKNPSVKFFKNSIELGGFQELLCGMND